MSGSELTTRHPARQDVPMDDRRTTEGVEHLQAAARELLSAARAFLDVVEEVVEDPEKVSNAAQGVSDLLRSGLGLVRRPEPWERSAWADDGADEGADAEPAGRVDTSWWDEPFGDEDGELTEPESESKPEPAADASTGDEGEPSATPASAETTAAKKAPAKKSAAKKAPAKKPAAKKASGTRNGTGAPSGVDATARPSRVRRIAVD